MYSENFHKAVAWYRSNSGSAPVSDEDTFENKYAELAKAFDMLASVVADGGQAPWMSYAGVDMIGDMIKDIDFERLSLFPVADMPAYQMYLEHVSTMWAAEELNFSVDAIEYKSLSDNNKRMYRLIVAFFHNADSYISAQVMKFKNETENMCEEAFLAVQCHIEMQHQHAYSLAAYNVITDKDEMDKVKMEVMQSPSIRKKFEFIMKYLNSPKGKGYRYLAGAFSEGVFFASLFAIVFKFRAKKIMTAFCTGNQWIMRDETYHRNFNCYMASKYGGFTIQEAHDMAMAAYQVEVFHIEHLLQEPFDSLEADTASNLTVEVLKQYAKSLVDQVLVMIGMPVLFDVPAPYMSWMVGMGLPIKENFYETKVTQYSQNSVKDGLMRVETPEGVQKLAEQYSQAVADPSQMDF